MQKNITQLWDSTLIRKHDLSGPRYTSYPTAPQFQSGFSAASWRHAIDQSNQSKNPLSLYFHIPFCDTVCYYCACNKIITANKKLATPYIEALLKEIQLQAAHVDHSRQVDQLHWGGGTPTYLSDGQMKILMDATAQHFNLHGDDSGEYSIEIHPHGVDGTRIKHLRSLGFNRLSMGIQDFNDDVQAAVNRFNSFEEVKTLIEAARDLQFHSTSIDLIYGLPLQTAESFALSLSKVMDLRPDRLSVFNYAHMPHLFKTQKQINAAQLPEPQEKLVMLQQSIETLLEQGYIYVGMDHFALPDDALAKAQAQKNLHRNFQGYTTHGSCDLLSFGVSSIAAFGGYYIQNYKSIDDYYAAIGKDELPINKGIALSDDDKLRRHVISELICHFAVNFADISKKYSIDFQVYFSKELESLKALECDGLLVLSPTQLVVNDSGRLLIRRICMIFDAYLDQSKKSPHLSPKYSRII